MSSDILGKIIKKGKKVVLNFGIGLAESTHYNKNIKTALHDFLKTSKDKIILYAKGEIIEEYRTHGLDESPLILYKKSSNPELDLVQDLKSNNVLAAIRGSFKSDLFLKAIKAEYSINEARRLALLETYNKEQFFFGPVGIDECNTLKSKISFIDSAINQLNKLKINPMISVLSGGRMSDIGRDPMVDYSIEEANKIVSYFRKKDPKIDIFYDEILIENAISNKSNLIIAPNGIAGNLIYRTLVHLGGGKAYGAIYMDLDNIIIDTSRVGDSSEIYGALHIAKALSNIE